MCVYIYIYVIVLLFKFLRACCRRRTCCRPLWLGFGGISISCLWGPWFHSRRRQKTKLLTFWARFFVFLFSLLANS